MKYLGTILTALLIIAGGYFGYNTFFSKPVTHKEFKKAHRILNKKIDTLRRNQHIMIKNQRIIYANQKNLKDSIAVLIKQVKELHKKLDSIQEQIEMLHYGQTVIYDAITSPQPDHSSESKFKRLIDWFSGK